MRILTVSILVLAALAAGCSTSSRPGDESAAGDADSDTDSDSDADTETGSESDPAPVGWHWMATAVNISGEFTQIAGRGTDDFLATGVFVSSSSITYIRYDGTAFTTENLGFGVTGTGVCVSSNSEYQMDAFDWQVDLPRFFSTQGETWTWIEIDLPSEPCKNGSWWPPGSFSSAGRSITCLEPDGFAALLICGVPAQDDQPQMINYYLLVHEGQGWETDLVVSVPGCLVPSSTLWGVSTDDIFVFVTHEGIPGYHFDGAELIPVTPPPGSWFNEDRGGVKAMAGSRASQSTDPGLWVTGIYREDGADSWRWRGFVWRSPDGLAWTDVPVPFDLPSECREYFLDLWLSEKGEVFVVGHRRCSTQNEGHWSIPLLLRFDGEDWEEVEIPPHPLSAGETRGQLQRIWGTDGEIFVGASLDLSMNHHAPAILRYLPE